MFKGYVQEYSINQTIDPYANIPTGSAMIDIKLLCTFPADIDINDFHKEITINDNTMDILQDIIKNPESFILYLKSDNPEEKNVANLLLQFLKTYKYEHKQK